MNQIGDLISQEINTEDREDDCLLTNTGLSYTRVTENNDTCNRVTVCSIKSIMTTELDDTRSFYKLIITTIKFLEKKKVM